MISDGVQLALIVAVPAALSPLLLSWLTNRNRRAEKAEDYARQDLVAARAEGAAAAAAKAAAAAGSAAQILVEQREQVAAQAREAASLLVESNRTVAEKAAEIAKVTLDRLDVIHTLVNSQMTKALTSEFEAITDQIVMMNEMASLKEAATGQRPAAEVVELIQAKKNKLAELRTVLDDRRRQAEIVAAQIGAQTK